MMTSAGHEPEFEYHKNESINRLCSGMLVNEERSWGLITSILFEPIL